ncbi:unnamed protein product [Sphagnum jensenii]
MRLSIAPMIDVTNTHFREFMRLVTRRSVLYTEMIHHDAVLHNHAFVLAYTAHQKPLVLQLGGSDPARLAEAARIAQDYGYDEINLNVGCPSPRVQKGAFGACLMKEAHLVRDCMEAMAEVVNLPVTVKCRLGVDEFDSYEFVHDFVKEVSRDGKGAVRHFIIHARKAFLKGLNPAQNRSIPPLQYHKVYQLRSEFPTISFELNGGIKTIADGVRLTRENMLAGVMIGRTAY